MSAETLTGSKLPRRLTYADYGVRLEPILNPVWRAVLYGLPWVIFIALVVEIISSTDSSTDWMFFSGQLAAALALFAFQVLMRQIPEAFDVLWSRNVIALKARGDADPSAAPPAPADSSVLAQAYGCFLKGVERSLNHPGNLVLGVMFAGLGIARFPYEFGGLGVFLRALPRLSLSFWWEILFEGFIGFVLGSMAWRMIFTALQVSALDRRFDLQVRFDHPDRAGGLEPLGTLCLWNALILAIAGIYFGGWLIVWPHFPRYINEVTQRFFYGDLFYRLILVPVVLAPVVFILPLWSVHSSMAAKAVEVRRDLDHLGERIDELGRTLLNGSDDLDANKAQQLTKNLEWMQQTYSANQNIPMWPLNVSILLKFASSQVVPLLGLTGLGQPLLKVVESFAKFVGQ